MTGRDETYAAALVVAGAFLLGFGMFTVAFGFAFSSAPAVVVGIGTVGGAVETQRRKHKLTSPNSQQLGEVAT